MMNASGKGTLNVVDKPDDTFIRPFSDVLREIGDGSIATEAAVALAELTQAVQATQKAGKFRLDITIEPVKKSALPMYAARAKVTVTTPGQEPTLAWFFADDAGNLLLDNPKQGSLFDRKIAEPDARIGDAR